MATPWTLERELCSLSGTTSAAEALWRLGIIEQQLPRPRIKEVEGWKRGGAETFIYRFRVEQSDTIHELLLKAVVAFSTTKSLCELGDEWIGRRRLLEQEGIRTPRLYHAGRAIVVEEFIPENLSSYLRRRRGDTAHLLDEVMRYAATLERRRFCPISPFHGLRTDGVDVFAVDFGQDLGPPGVTPRRGRRLLREAIRWLNRATSRSIDERRATAVFAFHASDARSEGTI